MSSNPAKISFAGAGRTGNIFNLLFLKDNAIKVVPFSENRLRFSHVALTIIKVFRQGPGSVTKGVM